MTFTFASLFNAATSVAQGFAVSPTQHADMLRAHNSLRRSVAAEESNRLGVTVVIPQLTWSAAAARVAKIWADHLLASGRFAHNVDQRSYGENLYSESGFAATTSAGSAARAFASWAGERHGYRFDSNTCADQCGHYTQIVWANTTSVGCGSATNGKETVWVCNYAPPGNFVGQRPYAK